MAKSKKSPGSALAHELAEARAFQAASTDILRLVKGSAADPQQIFDGIVETCRRLLAADNAGLRLVVDNDEKHFSSGVAVADSDASDYRPMSRGGQFPTHLAQEVFRSSIRFRYGFRMEVIIWQPPSPSKTFQRKSMIASSARLRLIDVASIVKRSRVSNAF